MKSNESLRQSRNEAARRWRERNPEKARASALRSYHKGETGVHERRIQRQFNVSYAQLLKAQGGVCLLCGEPPDEDVRLAVDHDHQSGQVRGLLHHRCNLAVGNLQESSARAEQAAAYLRRFSK